MTNHNIYDTDYVAKFANSIEDSKIDMENIKDRTDLRNRLEKFFYPKYKSIVTAKEPTQKQIDVLSDYYGVKESRFDKINYRTPPPTKTKENVNAYIVKGKTKRVVRDSKGRFKKWVD